MTGPVIHADALERVLGDEEECRRLISDQFDVTVVPRLAKTIRITQQKAYAEGLKEGWRQREEAS